MRRPTQLPPQVIRIIDPTTNSLSLNTELAPRQELYHYLGTISKKLSSITSRKTEIKTELGGTIVQDPQSRLATKIEYGGADPRETEVILTPKEIFAEISSYGVLDSRGKRRGTRHDIPGKKNIAALDGEEYLYTEERSRSHQTRKMRRTLGAPFLTNPRHLGRDYLLRENIIFNQSDPRIKNSHSSWVINAMEGNRVGYEPLLPYMDTITSRIIKPWQLRGIPTDYHVLGNGLAVTIMLAIDNYEEEYWVAL